MLRSKVAPMTRLVKSLQAWNTRAFAGALKAEILDQGAGTLPLQECTSLGGRIDGDALDITVLGMSENAAEIAVRLGVFLTEIMGGCSCGDDPVESNTWCVLRVRIDKATAAACFQVISE